MTTTGLKITASSNASTLSTRGCCRHSSRNADRTSSGMGPRPCFRFTTSADGGDGGGGPHSRVGPPPRSSVGGRRSRVRTGGGVDIAEVRQDHGPAGRHNPAAYECDPRVSARARG